MSSIAQSRLNAVWYAFAPSPAVLPTVGHAFDMDNRGLAYGDGFFTTMAMRAGDILWADQHRARIISHAQALGLAIDSAALWSAITPLAEQMGEGMLKLILTRTPQKSSFSFFICVF